ncbi:MAG: hypothetical protein FJ403_14290 [Verrucomicrobia bacterium]|nr:hypothetical protein [Verrucomicrobiota bacterium]
MKWSFSFLLIGACLLTFHLWLSLERHWIAVSAACMAALLNVALVRAQKQGYFVNGWDMVFHGAGILDMLIEGLFIPIHDNYGFYFCALGFVAALAAYRAVVARRRTFQW